MPKESVEDTAAQAKRILHEDQVSPNVQRIHGRMSEKLWILYHAQNYLLGVLQLLETAHLLRDPEADEKAEEQRRTGLHVFGEIHSDREDAYRQLVRQVVAWSGIPGAAERLDLIQEARDADEYRQLTRQFESDKLPQLIKQWREERRTTAEAAVERVRRLLDPKRKTVSMQALREALTGEVGAE